MKNIINILIIAFAFSGCNSSDYPVEDKLYECLVDEYKKKGIDIDPLLDSLEIELIEQNVLKGFTGEDKLDYYRDMANSGKIPRLKKYEFAEKIGLIEISMSEIEQCMQGSIDDSLLVKQSKHFKLNKKYSSHSDNSIKSLAGCDTLMLTSKDFEHPFYRAHMLITLTKLYDINNNYIREE